jgi:integrase
MDDTIDMAKYVEAKSDQLNSDDLIGGPRTITVARVMGCDGEQPIAIHYQGDGGKPFKPCKTIRRVLLAIWGRHAAEYVGRSMTLYRDDSVTFGGLNVGGIRISHMSHLDKETVVVVMKTKGKKAAIKVHPLVEEPKQQPKARQTAEEWTDKYVSDLKACATLADLVMLQEAAEEPKRTLEPERPPLGDALRCGDEQAEGRMHTPEEWKCIFMSACGLGGCVPARSGWAVPALRLPQLEADQEAWARASHRAFVPSGSSRCASRRVALQSLAPEYRKAYDEALTGVPNLNRAKPGTVDDLVSRYYQSLVFRKKGEEWQGTVRRVIETFRAKHGKFMVAYFKSKHIDAYVAEIFEQRVENGRKVGGPSAAKRMRDTLKALFKFAVKQEMIGLNPVENAENVPVDVKGFHAWTEDDIAQFRQRWALGTKARLAMELMLWMGARRGDARLLPPPRNGRIEWEAGKTGKGANRAVPAQLQAALDAMESIGETTILVTSFGETFSRNGFGNWFKDRCMEAGLPKCTAHGLRKAMTRRAAKRNVSQQGLKAIGQWSGDREVALYAQSVQEEELADEAIARVSEWEQSGNVV